MIYSVGIPVLVVIILTFWKRRHNKREEGKFRYRLHKLQRNLHNLAKHGYADVNSQEFIYLDNTLSKSIEKSNGITLFNLLLLEYRHRKIRRDIHYYRKIYNAALKKIESNLYLYEINESRIRIFTEYILSRNKITWYLIKTLFPSANANYRVKKFIRNRIVCSGYLPEISGIRRFLMVVPKEPIL